MAKESQAQPPHHSVCRPITENPSGIEAKGCAMTIESISAEHYVAVRGQLPQGAPHLGR